MNEILPSKHAMEICLKWMTELDCNTLGACLREKNNGKMLGILICTDNTVYKAYSGEIEGIDKSGFVPPCYDTDKMQALLNMADTDLGKEPDTNKKTEISRGYWEKIKDLYTFYCFDGTTKTLNSIHSNAQSGTGDCCAPRLLSYCYKNNKKPLGLAEFFYGDGSYEHKKFYTPCDERCKPILKHILGLDIVYQDDEIVVVNKPSGLLAIEGKTEKDCVAKRVRELYGTIQQPCVHRLDMATSGLMVLAKTQQAHDKLNSDFEHRRVFKLYKARVKGKILDETGFIDLPLRLDTDNRPHQIVDRIQGKQAQTAFVRERITKDCTKLILCPLTGRTHQLRVHMASIGHPIVGDALYDPEYNAEDPELNLHAWILQFHHPVTDKLLTFCEPCQNW